MSIIIEAVPNFSEGRRPDVVAAIVEAIKAPGVLLLDQSSDADHNRSVVTVAGAPDAVLEGAFRAVRTAAELIDMFSQRGAHPRIGATDVLPLVPIEGITVEECVQLAHQLAKRIAYELALPVYMYAAAATRPERRRLPDIRKGEFEGLLETIHTAERMPDYGPAKVGSAGAIVVGARPFLVAYNVYLNTGDVAIAKAIAKTIRESSGGYPAVQALGLLVEGQAQVSMNFVDTNVTPIHVVYDAIGRLAADQGVSIDRSELIGLTPRSVVFGAAAHYLKLPDLTPARTVEEAVRQSLISNL
jgi:glutamate formiminotransferase